MKLIARCVALGLAMLWTSCLTAAPPATRPGGTPHDSDALPPYMVKELSIPAGASVADLLQRVQREAPAFEYVALPGDWQKYPLPEIKLHFATLQEIVGLLKTLVPNLQVSDISGGSMLWVFQGRNDVASQYKELGAYGLSDPVERLGLRNALAALGNGEDTPTADQVAAGHKKALEQVLSLLESAATQADPSVQPSLKLHEDTEVLLVTGTRPQLSAISQSLKALQSAEGAGQYKESYRGLAIQYYNARSRAASLQHSFDQARETEQSLSRRAGELEKENAQLKAQLQAQKPGPGDKH